LINIQFREIVKLGAINLVAPQNGMNLHTVCFCVALKILTLSVCFDVEIDTAPSKIKFFINRHGMSFADAESTEGVQELSLEPEDLLANSLTMLNFLKFQSVASVQVLTSSQPELKPPLMRVAEMRTKFEYLYLSAFPSHPRILLILL
jgi:hypothetical protein